MNELRASKSFAPVLPTSELIGAVLDNRYRILRPIGAGGMGSVYLAEHTLLGEKLAVKVLSPRFAFDHEWVQRFHLEARAALRIRHENVVRVTDFAVSSPGLVYMVMELIVGESLADLLAREGRLPWRRALQIADGIAAALEAAHACGIIHRDVKPSNCVLTSTGGQPDLVKVLDFGIAKFMDPNAEGVAPINTSSGVWMGTAEYMALELFYGQPADFRADIYALGVVIYKMLTGSVPFPGSHGEVAGSLAFHVARPPSQVVPPDVSIPPYVDALVLHAMAKERSARTLTMSGLRADIAAALSGTFRRDEGEATGFKKPNAAPAALPPVAPSAGFQTSATAATRTGGRKRVNDVVAQVTESGSVSPERMPGSVAVLGMLSIAGLVVLVAVVWAIISRGTRTSVVSEAHELAPVRDVISRGLWPNLQIEQHKGDSSELALGDVSIRDPVTIPIDPKELAVDHVIVLDDSVPPVASEQEKKKPKTTSGRPRKTRRQASLQIQEIPEDVTEFAAYAELVHLDSIIQDKCFVTHGAATGTRIHSTIIVGGDGMATVEIHNTALTQIADCIGYWIVRVRFPTSWHGGRLGHTFVAR